MGVHMNGKIPHNKPEEFLSTVNDDWNPLMSDLMFKMPELHLDRNGVHTGVKDFKPTTQLCCKNIILKTTESEIGLLESLTVTHDDQNEKHIARYGTILSKLGSNFDDLNTIHFVECCINFENLIQLDMLITFPCFATCFEL